MLHNGENVMLWLSSDDGEGVQILYNLVGRAFLTVLDAIDREGELKAGSAYQDLGLVMSIYLAWSDAMPSYGTEGESVDAGNEEGDDWRRTTVACAKKGGIDLEASGCKAGAECVQDEGGELTGIEPLKGKAKVGRRKWPKYVSIRSP